jgi:hypothetical protein
MVMPHRIHAILGGRTHKKLFLAGLVLYTNTGSSLPTINVRFTHTRTITLSTFPTRTKGIRRTVVA